MFADPRKLLPPGAWARAVLVPALVFMALATDRNYLADFWHHLARGRAMAAEGRLVDEDRFTFTVPGRPFQDVNWLSQVGYHALFEAGGLELVRCVNALALAAALALLAVAVVFSLPGVREHNPLLRVSRQGPLVEDDLEAVHRHLRARVGAGRVFSKFEWGEHLSWTGAPDFKVFMDGRIEIYPDDVWDDYAAVTCGRPDWERILDARGVDFLLLDADFHGRTGLLARVARSAGWRQELRSRDALLFVRCPSRER
jgi:hypothetical protein